MEVFVKANWTDGWIAGGAGGQLTDSVFTIVRTKKAFKKNTSGFAGWHEEV